MEAARSARRVEHAHVSRQQPVERAPQRLGLELARELERGHLPERVDAGVRAPGARHGDARPAREPGERLLEGPLHGARQTRFWSWKPLKSVPS